MPNNYTCPSCDEAQLYRMDLIAADIPEVSGHFATSLDFECEGCNWEGRLLAYLPERYTDEMIQQAIKGAAASFEWCDENMDAIQTKFWIHEHVNVLDRLAAET
jgi:ribosomal protein L37AE/L43A